MKYEWLKIEVVLGLHTQSIMRFGGSSGIRDRGLLESAMGRAQNVYNYGEDISIAELAAAYMVGIARNHPFVDGNKRAALAAMGAFLYANGHTLAADKVELFALVLSVATGEITEAMVARWITLHLVEAEP